MDVVDFDDDYLWLCIKGDIDELERKYEETEWAEEYGFDTDRRTWDEVELSELE